MGENKVQKEDFAFSSLERQPLKRLPKLGPQIALNCPTFLLNKKRFTNLMKIDLTVTEDAVLTLKSCPDIKFPVVWTKHIKSPTLPVSLPSSISIFPATCLLYLHYLYLPYLYLTYLYLPSLYLPSLGSYLPTALYTISQPKNIPTNSSRFIHLCDPCTSHLLCASSLNTVRTVKYISYFAIPPLHFLILISFQVAKLCQRLPV